MSLVGKDWFRTRVFPTVLPQAADRFPAMKILEFATSESGKQTAFLLFRVMRMSARSLAMSAQFVTREGTRHAGLAGKGARIAALPWYVVILLGEAMFAVLKWILPALCSADPNLCRMAMSVAGLAWWFAGAFALCGILALLRQRPCRRFVPWRN